MSTQLSTPNARLNEGGDGPGSSLSSPFASRAVGAFRLPPAARPRGRESAGSHWDSRPYPR